MHVLKFQTRLATGQVEQLTIVVLRLMLKYPLMYKIKIYKIQMILIFHLLLHHIHLYQQISCFTYEEFPRFKP